MIAISPLPSKGPPAHQLVHTPRGLYRIIRDAID
jgi:hypothetical protein